MEPFFSDYAFPLIYAMSIIAFVATAYDKHLERCSLRRIPSALLLIPAVPFGAFGTLCAMIIFGHLTDRKLFTAGIPSLLAVQLAFVIYKIMS